MTVDERSVILARARSTIESLGEYSFVLFLGFTVTLPFGLQLAGISLTYAIEILVFALAAYGVHLLYGYTGLLSFGHAAFFGGSAYVTTYLLVEYQLPLLSAIILGVLAAIVLAAVIGFFSIRQYGIYFAILTLAFGQILFFLVRQLDITGGVHGLIGLFDRPPINLGVFSYGINNTLQLYGFVAVLTVTVIYLLLRFLNSQLGSVLIAVRENERRAASIGYNVRRAKLISFVISGAITGLAGALYTIYLGIANPDLLHWSISGEFLFIVILGGAHTFFGPVVGSVIYYTLRETITTITDRWQFFVGLLFLLLVHFAPEGFVVLLYDKGRSVFTDD